MKRKTKLVKQNDKRKQNRKMIKGKRMQKGETKKNK